MVRRGTVLVAHLAMLAGLGFSIVGAPRPAHAEAAGTQSVPVAVLAIDSDDAEDHADALTNALRSRVRTAPAWSLLDTNQSLGMLTAALKCPQRPTPECQQKIAAHIRAERFVFGFLSKGPVAGHVTAEIHLFQRGKADTVVRESYAENLKDANDDALRRIAGRIVERLSGGTVGTVLVHATDVTGDVVINGEKHIPLENGNARIELAPGSHAIEVVALGVKRNIIVTAGQQTNVDFVALQHPEPHVRRDAKHEGSDGASSSHARPIVGGVVMGAGVALGTLAIVELLHYFDLQKRGEERAAQLDKNDVVNGSKPCREYDAACAQLSDNAQLASGLAIGLGVTGAAALGIGAYFLFTGASPSAHAKAPRLVPAMGKDSRGVMLVGEF